jgi:hypothetical protein
MTRIDGTPCQGRQKSPLAGLKRARVWASFPGLSPWAMSLPPYGLGTEAVLTSRPTRGKLRLAEEALDLPSMPQRVDDPVFEHLFEVVLRSPP